MVISSGSGGAYLTHKTLYSIGNCQVFVFVSVKMFAFFSYFTLPPYKIQLNLAFLVVLCFNFITTVSLKLWPIATTGLSVLGIQKNPRWTHWLQVVCRIDEEL